MLETFENPLGSKKIKPVNPEGNQPSIFIERTDAEAEAPILWPPDEKSWLLNKTLMLKVWGQDEKGVTEDEMVKWHHWLNGHEFLSKLAEIKKDREAWHAAVHGVTKSKKWFSDWTMTTTTTMVHSLRACISFTYSDNLNQNNPTIAVVFISHSHDLSTNTGWLSWLNPNFFSFWDEIL